MQIGVKNTDSCTAILKTVFLKNGWKNMEVNQSFKTEEGTLTFQGELSQEELDIVIQVGLSTLFSQGLIPFKVSDEIDIASVAPAVNSEN